jgi:hypothetical protein
VPDAEQRDVVAFVQLLPGEGAGAKAEEGGRGGPWQAERSAEEDERMTCSSEESMMLELRPNGECCNRDLPPDSWEALICSFECTFCRRCAEGILGGVCPNCEGELVSRPVRPASKLKGEFIWHHHEAEDQLFLVVDGRLRMQFRDGDREVGPGEFIIMPKGVEHCPLALTDEVHVVLLEPKTT